MKLRRTIAILMVIALMASMSVFAAADGDFNYNDGGIKPMDLVFHDGAVEVSLKAKLGWTNIDLIDTAAIARNVAWTLYCNGMNYQPIIDTFDVFHWFVISPCAITVPIFYTGNANPGELVVVAFGFNNGDQIDYELIGPNGLPVKTGKVTINDNIGKVDLTPAELAALGDGDYQLVLSFADPTTGAQRKFYGPFGVKGGRLTLASGAQAKTGGLPAWWTQGGGEAPAKPVKPTPAGNDWDHGFTIKAHDSQAGAHWNETTDEVTITLDKYNFTFPTKWYKGEYSISTEPVAPSAPGVEVDYHGGEWLIPFVNAFTSAAFGWGK